MLFPDAWEGAYACAGIAVGLEFFDKVVPFVVIGNSSFAIGYWILKIMLSMVIGVFLIPIMLLWYINGILRVKVANLRNNFLSKHKENEALLKNEGRFPGQLDMYHIFPILKNNEDYEIIYNHCKNDDELSEFTHDWKNYFLDLQSKVYLNPQKKPSDLYFTFNEWYQQNQRWKCTSYNHLYYKLQEKKYNFKDNDKEEELEGI